MVHACRIQRHVYFLSHFPLGRYNYETTWYILITIFVISSLKSPVLICQKNVCLQLTGSWSAFILFMNSYVMHVGRGYLVSFETCSLMWLFFFFYKCIFSQPLKERNPCTQQGYKTIISAFKHICRLSSTYQTKRWRLTLTHKDMLANQKNGGGTLSEASQQHWHDAVQGRVKCGLIPKLSYFWILHWDIKLKKNATKCH